MATSSATLPLDGLSTETLDWRHFGPKTSAMVPCCVWTLHCQDILALRHFGPNARYLAIRLGPWIWTFWH